MLLHEELIDYKREYLPECSVFMLVTALCWDAAPDVSPKTDVLLRRAPCEQPRGTERLLYSQGMKSTLQRRCDIFVPCNYSIENWLNQHQCINSPILYYALMDFLIKHSLISLSCAWTVSSNSLHPWLIFFILCFFMYMLYMIINLMW